MNMPKHVSDFLTVSALALAAPVAAQPGSPYLLYAQSAVPQQSTSAAGNAAADRDLANRVRSALAADAALATAGISVSAAAGTVTLSGSTTGKRQADRAMTLAQAQPGVKSVVSKIQIREN